MLQWIKKNLSILGLALLLSFLAACSTRTAPVYNRSIETNHNRSAKTAGLYLVRKGDTLYSIAWRHGLDYRLLANWNGISAPRYQIYPGQRLRLKPRPVVRRPSKIKSVPSKQNRLPKVTVQPAPIARPVTKKPSLAKTAQPVAKPKPKPKLKVNWRWPTKGRVIQTYSSKDPTRRGIKIQGVSGQPILAAESGRVVYSGSGLVGYGNLIIIKHNDKYLSAYGYNKKILVKEGDKVARHERIATMGSPRNGADPVLHFEIRRQGKPINPLPLLPK